MIFKKYERPGMTRHCPATASVVKIRFSIFPLKNMRQLASRVGSSASTFALLLGLRKSPEHSLMVR
jgi:hypothetical protein